MEIYEMIDLNDCPVCGGAGLLEEECGSGYCVTCMDCGAHSIVMDFKNDDERFAAASKTAEVWNIGKVIASEPGE